MALALAPLAASAFSAPALAPRTAGTAVSMTAIRPGDVGTTRPLGVYDPLGLIEKRDMRRYEIMEIKHGTSLSNWHLKFLTHR